MDVKPQTPEPCSGSDFQYVLGVYNEVLEYSPKYLDTDSFPQLLSFPWSTTSSSSQSSWEPLICSSRAAHGHWLCVYKLNSSEREPSWCKITPWAVNLSSAEDLHPLLGALAFPKTFSPSLDLGLYADLCFRCILNVKNQKLALALSWMWCCCCCWVFVWWINLANVAPLQCCLTAFMGINTLINVAANCINLQTCLHLATLGYPDLIIFR